jgi:hypothetical protein
MGEAPQHIYVAIQLKDGRIIGLEESVEGCLDSEKPFGTQRRDERAYSLIRNGTVANLVATVGNSSPKSEEDGEFYILAESNFEIEKLQEDAEKEENVIRDAER